MPIQLFAHTPAHVWAVLAVLVWRGLVERRERETTPRRLFVIPLSMLALALYDMLTRFDGAVAALAAWATMCIGAGWAISRYGHGRIAPGATRERVRVRGGCLPLFLMLAIFAVKYVAAVVLALHPDAVREQAFVLAVCASLGVFNGIFLGRLMLDVAACRALGRRFPGGVQA